MKRLKSLIYYLVSVQIIVLTFFSAFRLVLCLFNKTYWADESFGLIIPAFLKGLRFDIVTSSIFLSVAAVVELISLFFKEKKIISRIVSTYICVIYTLCLLLWCADIPYFNYFFKHIDSSIWSYLQQPKYIINMAIESPVYLVSVVVFIVISFCLCKFFVFLRKKFLETNSEEKISSKREILCYISSLFIILPLFLVSMRGTFRLGHDSLRISDSYYCNNPFLNQVALNPAYTLIRTSMAKAKDDEIHFIDNNIAIEKARKELHVETDSLLYISPIARYVSQADTVKEKNVVVIIMESMASHFVADSSLTPFLNQLKKKSIFFPNAYSSGIHTRNGVWSTLFSYPALMSQSPFPHYKIVEYDSWPGTMKKLGYKTLYFTSHYADFDNIRAYLVANSMETIISEEDYPSEEICNIWGCSDDFLFRNAIPILSNVAKQNLFFATLLTTSNHPPYALPKYFKPRTDDVERQAVEYADYSLRIFFEKAQKEPWYDNTIFVLLGDHGSLYDGVTIDYDIPLSLHKTPIFIFDPSNKKPYQEDALMGQMDVYPTVMGMLGFAYVNNGFGIDVLKEEKRSYMYFSSDDAFCCIDSVDYYVCRSNGLESLYHFKDMQQENIISENPTKAEKMKKEAQSMIQAAQYLVKQKQAK